MANLPRAARAALASPGLPCPAAWVPIEPTGGATRERTVQPHAFSVQSIGGWQFTQGGVSCARWPWADLPGTFGANRTNGRGHQGADSSAARFQRAIYRWVANYPGRRELRSLALG